MKKMQKKLSLSRETLRRLDDGYLADAVGGKPILPSKTTADPTECTVCYICNSPIANPGNPIANPIGNPIAQPADPIVVG